VLSFRSAHQLQNRPEERHSTAQFSRENQLDGESDLVRPLRLSWPPATQPIRLRFGRATFPRASKTTIGPRGKQAAIDPLDNRLET
jgi:hypothetical protein